MIEEKVMAMVTMKMTRCRFEVGVKGRIMLVMEGCKWVVRDSRGLLMMARLAVSTNEGGTNGSRS